MIFIDYGDIRQSLIAICDSIDRYFKAFVPIQPQTERSKLYQKLYSISKVYDDPTGLTIPKIMSLLRPLLPLT